MGDQGPHRPPAAARCEVPAGKLHLPPPKAKTRLHIAEKPVALLRDLMAIAPEGCTVLDPFMGSCSCGVACAETGRRFVGVEMTEHYYAVARDRLAAAWR